MVTKQDLDKMDAVATFDLASQKRTQEMAAAVEALKDKLPPGGVLEAITTWRGPGVRLTFPPADLPKA